MSLDRWFGDVEGGISESSFLVNKNFRLIFKDVSSAIGLTHVITC
jgi:hypothetical protein